MCLSPCTIMNTWAYIGEVPTKACLVLSERSSETVPTSIVSDPRRGCYIVLLVFIFFFFLSFFLFSATFVRAISLEPLLAETPNSVCSLVLLSNFAL